MREEHKELLGQFTAWMQARGHKPRGMEEIIRRVRQYLAYAREHQLDIAAMGIREAEAYREHLRLFARPDGRPHYSPKTINAALSGIRLLYRYLMAAEQ